VPNRSLVERWRKWRKRRPLGLPLGLAVAAVVVAGAGVFVQGDRQSGRARAALRDGQALLDRGRYREAAEACRTAEALLEGLPFQRGLRARLGETRQSADRAQAAADLHALCEQVRPLYAAEVLPPAQARGAADRCRELWAARTDIVSRLSDQPTPELEARWRTDLLDLGVLTAHLEARAAPTDAAAHERSLMILAEAEELLGPSAVLYLERARHARAVGRPAEADVAEGRAAQFAPRTAWDHLAVGRARLGAGDLAGAAVALDRCVELDPRSAWGHYHRGVCALRMNEPLVAVAAFSACLALHPDSAWCLYNRGLAYAAAGRADRATADLGQALARDPDHGPARELLGRLPPR
jgi:tetratricopeptide (TPR) repeat protein